MLFDIEHLTHYQYFDAVRLDAQTLRLTPRPEAGIHIHSHELKVWPPPSRQSESDDADGNRLTVLEFEGATTELSILSKLSVETGLEPITCGWLEMSARPRFLERKRASEEIDRFAQRIYNECGRQIASAAEAIALDLFRSIRQVVRDTGEPFSPSETLSSGQGACRDLSVLMMDACRALGLPARFVSGYQKGDIDLEHRHLHAWVEVYLEGRGWTGYDPTLGEEVGDTHIALAASPLPSQTAPVTGTFWSAMAGSQLDCRLTLSAR